MKGGVQMEARQHFGGLGKETVRTNQESDVAMRYLRTYLIVGIDTTVCEMLRLKVVLEASVTSGVLDRVLTSRTQKHEKLMTPELAIQYKPVNYPHAPHPGLDSDPTRS